MRVIARGKSDFPVQIRCPECFSLIEYDKEDISTGAFGLARVKCPVCGEWIDLDDGEHDKHITTQNMCFPDDFYHFGGKGCVNISDNYIEEEIERIIKQMYASGNDGYYYSATGNTFIFIEKDFDSDKPNAYRAIVCKDYWELEDIEYKGE